MDLHEIFTKMSGESTHTGDLVGNLRSVHKKVDTFLASKGATSSTERLGVRTISSSFSAERAVSIDGADITELVQSAGVPKQYAAEAAREVTMCLARAAIAGGSTPGMVEAHLATANAATGSTVYGIEQLLPDSLQGMYSKATSSVEHFGVDTDKLESDLALAITVTLMKWHNSVAARMLPIIATVNPLVVLKRVENKIYDLADANDKLTSVVDLFKDPSKVSNELKPLVVKAANHAAIDTDGIIPLNKEINLFAAALDAAKYGQGSVNRTDYVADEVKVTKVHVKASWTDGQDEKEDELIIVLPANRATMHRIPNAPSTSRSVAINYHRQFGKTSKNASDVAIGAAGGLWTFAMTAESDNKINLAISLTPNLNVRTSDFNAYGQVVAKAVTAAGADVVEAGLANVTFEITGIEIDARQSEENTRRMTIVSTLEVSKLQYEIPQGRTFGADRSHREAQSVDAYNNQVATLMSLATIGQDDVFIRTVQSYLDTVNDEQSAWEADKVNNVRPGSRYAAGGKVNPSVLIATMNVGDVSSFDDARRRAAIGHRIESVFGSIVAELMTKSMMRQQLAPGSKLVFRCLTNNNVLTNIIAIGANPVEVESAGIQYAMKLPDGTILEFVTTTFENFGDKVVMIPVIKEDVQSDLNFGLNYNCGTHACAFNASMDGANAQRIVASVREFVIPSNIVGASISITGVDVATFRAKPEVE
jgi:hypothetical protein